MGMKQSGNNLRFPNLPWIFFLCFIVAINYFCVAEHILRAGPVSRNKSAEMTFYQSAENFRLDLLGL